MQLRNYQQYAFDAVVNFAKYRDEPAIVVVPTGGGKSHIIAKLADHYKAEGKRVAIIAHRKELLEQNGSKLNVDFGYYSASLGGDNLESDIILAGVASIYNKDFQPFDVILYDECQHLNNSKTGQGWQFIEKSPKAKLIGFTATPYRLAGGKLNWGKTVYEISYSELLEQKYLTKITNKSSGNLDLSNIKIVAGDYNEALLAEYMRDPELIEAAVKNIISYGKGRNYILIFCVTVSHAKILTECMQKNGLQSFCMDGKTPKAEREQAVKDFKEGRLHHLINCQVFTEGFDAPELDMIVCLRPTKSKALWEQILGRGVRLADGKNDCLLIDMAGNLLEHGGIGTPYHEPAKNERLLPKGKVCPQCEGFVKTTARECPDCGFQFPKPETKQASHDDEANMRSSAVYNALEKIEITGMRAREHIKRKGDTESVSLRIDYIAPCQKYGAVSKWLSVYHENDWVRNQAYKFFEAGGHKLASDTNSYSMEDLLWHAAKLKVPSHITMDFSKKFPEIKELHYEEKPPSPIEELLEDDLIPF